MRVAVYARVSTEDQNEANQMPDIERLIQARGFEIVATYAERASAWRSGHQAELSRLIQDAKDGRFDAVVVWALDRLTREGPHRILALYKRFQDLGVQVISCRESWTEYPSEVKPLLMAIMGWIAEQESKRQSERTRAGLLRRQRNGGRLGRPPGAKDRRRRRTEGYRLRQAKERIRRAEIGAAA